MSTIKAETQAFVSRFVEPDASVDHVVRRLNAIGKRVTFALALSVGKLIIDSFYGGDLCAWRHRGAKDVSFRKLAKHPDLSMSASVLNRSVAIYELTCRLGINPHGHLSSTHLRVALPLKKDEQERVLRLAEAEGWSVTRLSEEIEDVLRSTPPPIGGGRRRQAPLRRTLRALDKCLCESPGLASVDDLGEEISPERAMEAASLLRRVQHACVSLERRILASASPTSIDDPGPSDSDSEAVASRLEAAALGSGCWPTGSRGSLRAGSCEESILIVEDDRSFARALLRIASNYGDAVHAETAARVETILADGNRHWKAFILDLFLPDGHGLKLLEQLRPRFPTIPALIVTGHLDGDAVNAAYDLRAAFLLKPFAPSRIDLFLSSQAPLRSASSTPGLARASATTEVASVDNGRVGVA
jgi:ActR/RegA family two-component response regulator